MAETLNWGLSGPATLIALVVGYLFGSIPFGIILTKLAGGPDLRSIGSGNIGATNVLRTGNKKLAAATLVGDMLKGTVAVLVGARWTFDARWPYVASLAYLAVFGSVFAFGAYLTLLKAVGAGPASWVGVSTPVVAMLLSTAFEGYRWTTAAVVGVVLAVVGNILALRPPRSDRS